MIKTLTNLLKQDKEKFVVPKGVQDCIPITAIYDDGIFRVGKDKYSKSFKFTDINFAVASREDKEAMFLEYSELLNSLDSGATTKLTINNRRLNRLDFEKTILIPETGDELDVYREEYNKMLLDKATGANAIVQDKYVTISINKKSVEDARTYFARVGADLIAHFARLGSKCVELETDERLRIVHDFFRVGEETAYHFNIKETRKKGHDFKDYVCPDTMEFEKDYFKMGNRYGRVLFLREYASYIKDSMVAELTDLNRNLMMSIDIVPVPTDEAVREAESRLLGVETNIKDTFKEKIWGLPAADLLGVGRATQRVLDSYCIRTIGDLANTDPEFLRRRLGKNGVVLWNYANGNDLSLVAKKDFVSPIKSVGHGITTVADLEKPEQVWPVFLELTQDIGHKLRVHGLSAEGVAIHIRDNTLNTRQWQTKIALPTQSPMIIAKTAFQLFEKRYGWNNPIRSVTVQAINLVPQDTPRQIDMFMDAAKQDKLERMEKCVEEIRRRFGKDSIRNGVLCQNLRLPPEKAEITMPTGMVG